MCRLLRVGILVVALNTASLASRPTKPRSPGDEANRKDVASVTSPSGDTVEWDPERCWDCSAQDELVGLFFLGLICSIPVFTFLRIRKTQTKNSLRVKSQLGI